MKLRVVLLLLFVSLISFVKPAEAAFEWGDGGGVGAIDQTWQEVMAGDQVVLPVFIRQVFLWTAKTVDNTLWGEQTGAVEGSSVGSLQPAQRKGGVIQGAANLAGLIYENPAGISTVNYLASINPIPQARAATGAEQLGLALPLWKITRNLAYLLTSIILVAFGLMIMFRKKIDPRTTVTISHALPKIIITLILITFSYPIAGILFDVMRVGKTLTHTVLQQQLFAYVENIPEEYRLGDLTEFPTNFRALDIWTVFGVGGGIRDLLGGQGVGNEIIVELAGIEVDASLMLGLAMGIMLFSLALKVLFSLITYYIRFFLLTISAPLTFLWGALPGQEEHTGRWFMQFISTSVIFIAMYLMMNLAYFFYMYSASAPTQPGVPYIIGMFGPAVLGKLMAFGILLTLPTIPETIDDLLAPTKKHSKPMSETLSRGMKSVPIIGGLLG